MSLNPGFLSLILICISLILLASGWKRTLLQGVSDLAVVSFFAGWCSLSFVHFRWWGGVDLYGVVVVLTVLIATITASQQPLSRGVHSVSLGLFIASVYYLLKHLGDIDPLFLLYRSEAGAVSVVALLTALLVRKVKDQIACISLSLLLGSIMYEIVHRHHSPIQVGGLLFQDEWWLAVVSARALTLASDFVRVSIRFGTKSLAGLWKGLKK